MCMFKALLATHFSCLTDDVLSNFMVLKLHQSLSGHLNMLQKKGGTRIEGMFMLKALLNLHFSCLTDDVFSNFMVFKLHQSLCCGI